MQPEDEGIDSFDPQTSANAKRGESQSSLSEVLRDFDRVRKEIAQAGKEIVLAVREWKEAEQEKTVAYVRLMEAIQRRIDAGGFRPKPS